MFRNHYCGFKIEPGSLHARQVTSILSNSSLSKVAVSETSSLKMGLTSRTTTENQSHPNLCASALQKLWVTLLCPS